MGAVETLADDLLALIVQEDPLAEMVIGFPGSEEQAPRSQRERGAGAAGGRDGGHGGRAGGRWERSDHRGRGEPAGRRADRPARRPSGRPRHDRLQLRTGVAPAHDPPVTRPPTPTPTAFFRLLVAVPGYLETVAERNRTGVAARRLPVADRAEHLVRHLDGYLADPAGDPLRRVPVADSAERDRLLLDVVRPAFARYRDVVAAEVVPRGRPADQPGLCWIPGGDSAYTGLVRMHTTTDRTPQELHDTGLELIAALADEYVEIGSRTFGLHTVEEIRARLRSDPSLRWGTPRRCSPLPPRRSSGPRRRLRAGSGSGPRTVACWSPCPRWTRPRPVGLLPAGDSGRQPTRHVLRQHPSDDRARPHRQRGHRVPRGRAGPPLPGQHLPGARGPARPPPARRDQPFAEGWGLYSERLADEMGLYSGGIARLGMLGQDSVRAARLVVDTGLHAFGWSRQQVVDYLRGNTVMSEVEVQHETDRYIEAPGQALSYMVGRLESSGQGPCDRSARRRSTCTHHVSSAVADPRTCSTASWPRGPRRPTRAQPASPLRVSSGPELAGRGRGRRGRPPSGRPRRRGRAARGGRSSPLARRQAAVLGEPVDGVGVEHLAPDVGVVAGAVAAAEDVVEVGGAVARRRGRHVDARGRAAPRPRTRSTSSTVVVRREAVPRLVQQRRGEVLRGREALAEPPRRVQPLAPARPAAARRSRGGARSSRSTSGSSSHISLTCDGNSTKSRGTAVPENVG